MTLALRLLTLAIVIALAAAAAIAPGAAMPRTAAAAIEIITPANPTHLPLIARLGKSSGRDPTLSQHMAEQKLRIGDELALAFEAALKRGGFNAFIAGRGAQPPTARLTLIIEEAGYERRVWGKIGPKLTVRVRVHDAMSGERLFADTYVYDMYAQTIGWTMLRPPPEYGFEEPEEVLARPEVAAAGFRTGIRMIADRAVEDIVAGMDD